MYNELEEIRRYDEISVVAQDENGSLQHQNHIQ